MSTHEWQRPAAKDQVRAYYGGEPCGARYGRGAPDRLAYYREIERKRYELDYMIKDFAHFHEAKGKRVLEVGVGMGSDFMQWCRAGAEAHGRDLTDAAVQHVRERLELEGYSADVAVGDAENLDFPSNYFDIYYSWGVLMYPDTEKALAEAHRVLKPGGRLKIMLYKYPSVAAMLVWTARGLLKGRIRSPRECFATEVEGVGTRIFTIDEIRSMVGRHFRSGPIDIRTHLAAGDLLTHTPSEKYAGRVWKAAVRVYPRWFVRSVLGDRFGLYATVEATKEAPAGSASTGRVQ